MKGIKLLTMIGLAANTMAHGHHKSHHSHDHNGNNAQLYEEQQEFLAVCSSEVSMCQDILAPPSLVIDESSGSQDPSPPSSSKEVALQCLEDTVAACIPALESKDIFAIRTCIREHDSEFVDNLKNLSEECQEAIKDWILHPEPHRKRHGEDHDEDRDDEDHDEDRDDDDADDDDDQHTQNALGVPGSQIGQCLMNHTMDLSAPCLAAAEAVNASGADWSFLDVLPPHDDFHSWAWMRCVLAFFALVLTAGCCVRCCRKKRCCKQQCNVQNNFPGVAPQRPTPAGRPVITYSAGEDTSYLNRGTVNQQDTDMARAIRASLDDQRAQEQQTASAPPASAQDMPYTGNGLSAPLLNSMAQSDQYV